MHAVEAECGAVVERFVLRRFVLKDWLDDEPDLAEREAIVLRALEATSLPTPRLVAYDPTGVECGVPSVLMTMLSGVPVLNPPDIADWCARLADTLSAIHAARVELPYRYRRYHNPGDLRIPEWTQDAALWKYAIAIAGEPPPVSDDRLVHRDYNPSNVLWASGRVSGVVDWVNACRGPGGVDIGHCRRNLALLHGVEVADLFLEECRHWTEHHPYWDVVSLLDAIPKRNAFSEWSAFGVEINDTAVQTHADAYLASIVARL
jgi:aminoglycoside phosphotransferase (APT) family kinase protein